jgi:hypothetical protein
MLRQYQKKVKEDTCWFSIELEWHMKSTYTDYEKQQLIEVFGKFPEQEILIFGECDRIFVAAHELIRHFGGMLYINLSVSKSKLDVYPGKKIPVYKKHHNKPSRYIPDRWLVDHLFIREFFKDSKSDYYEKFKLDPFIYIA